MGYYNPFLSYGKERLLNDCCAAGVNGFIVVDLPPHEAVKFRNICANGGCVGTRLSQRARTDNSIDYSTYL